VLGAAQLRVSEFGERVSAGTMGFWEGFAQNTAIGVFGGAGFALALFLMAAIRERLDLAPVPEAFRGMPVAFIAAACMAFAFFGFSGMV